MSENKLTQVSIDDYENLDAYLAEVGDTELLDIFDEITQNSSFSIDSKVRKVIDLLKKTDRIVSQFHTSLISIQNKFSIEISKRYRAVILAHAPEVSPKTNITENLSDFSMNNLVNIFVTAIYSGYAFQSVGNVLSWLQMYFPNNYDQMQMGDNKVSFFGEHIANYTFREDKFIVFEFLPTEKVNTLYAQRMQNFLLDKKSQFISEVERLLKRSDLRSYFYNPISDSLTMDRLVNLVSKVISAPNNGSERGTVGHVMWWWGVLVSDHHKKDHFQFGENTVTLNGDKYSDFVYDEDKGIPDFSFTCNFYIEEPFIAKRANENSNLIFKNWDFFKDEVNRMARKYGKKIVI